MVQNWVLKSSFKESVRYSGMNEDSGVIMEDENENGNGHDNENSVLQSTQANIRQGDAVLNDCKRVFKDL